MTMDNGQLSIGKSVLRMEVWGNGSFGALRLIRTTEETCGLVLLHVILRVALENAELKNPFPELSIVHCQLSIRQRNQVNSLKGQILQTILPMI